MGRFAYIKTNTTTRLQALLDLMETELPAHGGYEAVDVVNSPGGMPARVWKSKGTVNPIGRDFYFIIARTIANPIVLHIAVAEGYNSTTKMVSRPAPGTNMSSAMPAADYSYGGGTEYPIWTGATGSTLNTTDIFWLNANCSASYAYDLWLVTTAAGIYMWMLYAKTIPASSIFVGVGERLSPENYDIIVVSDFLNDHTATTASNTIATRTTRHPTITSPQMYNWMWDSPVSSGSIWTPHAGKLNGEGDRLWNGRPIAGRRAIVSAASASLYGTLLGLWPNLLVIGTQNAGGSTDTVAAGDQTTVPRLDGTGLSDTYAYAFRSGNSTAPMWVNTTAP